MNFTIIRENALINKSQNEDELKKHYEIINKTFQRLDLINTKGIKPAHFPYILKNNYLREDKAHNIDYGDFTNNIEVNSDNFVVINGVKNE